LSIARTKEDLRFHRSAFDKHNKEIAMIDREEKRRAREKKAQEEHQVWQDLQDSSKAYWSHWRAWGSWFSWGSPIGLGMFFVLVAVTFAIFKWALGL
jgi:hypothetical protein